MPLEQSSRKFHFWGPLLLLPLVEGEPEIYKKNCVNQTNRKLILFHFTIEFNF